MGIDTTETVDAIGLNKSKRIVTLTIFDSWDWSDESGHLIAIQAKLNSYLGFIQSGQIFEAYPTAMGKELYIDVVTQYPLTAKAVALLRIADNVARKLNVRVTHRVQATSQVI